MLGLQPDINLEDFNPNDPVFGQIKKATIRNYNLVVIDEASMVNAALFELENSYELTQFMRQASDNPLAPLSQQLRQINDKLPEFLI